METFWKGMIAEVERTLQLELKRRVKSEAQVCYILVLARKLLEHERQQVPQLQSPEQAPATRAFATLQFFCDWALHIKLTRDRAGRLLQEFDRQVPAMLEGAHDDLTTLKSAKLLKLREFMIEFSALLIKHNIEFPGHNTFALFLTLYLNIISNCPVSYDQKQLELKYIDKLMVTKHPDAARFQWELSIKGHPVYSWDHCCPAIR